MPLGAVQSVRADVRILAATNRDLAAEVRSRRFRQDLFFRLDIVRIALPPLRNRVEDIPMLVKHFIARFNALQGRRIAGISVPAMGRLLAYSFPGNVRELENAIEHAFVVCCSYTIEVGDLPPHIVPDRPATPPVEEASLGPLRSAEAATIREALERNAGKRGRATEELGISRNTLWRKMKRYGIR